MSAIKLSTPSSGSISLSPADTASNLTITVPATTATMATVDGSGNMSVTGNLSFNSGYGSAAVAYGCRAWVNFNGTGTVAIRASGNVSSITDNGTGDYTVNMTTSMPDLNYSAMGAAGTTSALDVYQQYWVYQKDTETRTASSVRMVVVQHGAIGGWIPAPSDVAQVNIAIFR